MNATKNFQANTFEVSSRRGKRKARKAAKKNGNANKKANASLSAQQPVVKVEESSEGKMRMVNGGKEYKGDSEWRPAIYHDDIRGHLLAEGPQGRKFLKRAGRHALDESMRQKRNEVEEQRSEKLEARHNEIVGAAPLLALAIPPRQVQGQKRKREQSSLDPEGEEENTRPAKRQEWAFNIDPALMHAGGSGEASDAFVVSAPDSWNEPNGIGGLGRANSPRFQCEAPELPTQIPDSDAQEFGFVQDLDVSAIADEDTSGPVEETPLYMDQPAATGPYFLNRAQLQAFAKAQLPDGEVDFRWIRPRNQMDEVLIRAALHYTRKDCRERLGVNTLDVPSTPWETYSHQYLEIQTFFRQLWGYHEGGEKAPSLMCLEAWDGGFDGWKAPSIELD